MKKPFNVITPGEVVSSSELELGLRSFAKFYHTLTAKHRKRIILTIITSKQKSVAVKNLATHYNISDVVIIKHSQHNTNHDLFTKATLMLLPSYQGVDNIINQAFSCGLPVLGYTSKGERQYIDNTCGLTVKPLSIERNVEAFCKKMQMLYFDSEAQKILKRGAKRKYNNLIQMSPPEMRLPLAS